MRKVAAKQNDLNYFKIIIYRCLSSSGHLYKVKTNSHQWKALAIYPNLTKKKLRKAQSLIASVLNPGTASDLNTVKLYPNQSLTIVSFTVKY